MEEEIIALLKINDEKALKKLFDLYHTPLCMLAFHVVKDKDQAKDIVQDVFIKLWKNRERLEITVSFSAYLKRATINTALNFVEASSRLNRESLEKADLSFHSQNTTERNVAYQELKRRADAVILRLPIRTRTVFTLIRSEEMSYKEVAEALGISMKAVEKEMLKALKILREALKDYLPSAILPIMAGMFY